MTGDLRPGPPNVLETTRVRGGGSARLGAVALAAILGLVVWVGVSGRATPVVPPSLGPEVAHVPSPRATPTVGPSATPEPSISPTPQPSVPPPAAVASIETGDLSLIATIGGRQFMTWLRPTDQGHLSGTFGIPIPPPATDGKLKLEQVWRTVEQAWRSPSHRAWATLSTWDLRLESLSAASGREYIVLDRTIPARTARGVSLLVSRGYRIIVRAQSGTPRGLMTVDIQIAPGHQLVGDDGSSAGQWWLS